MSNTDEVKPEIIEKFTDNGEHSHWELIESKTGRVLWSESSPAPVSIDVEKEGKLWSIFRTLLSQGGDIMKDYDSGLYKSYEEYSARMDAAARERVEQFLRNAPHTTQD